MQEIFHRPGDRKKGHRNDFAKKRNIPDVHKEATQENTCIEGVKDTHLRKWMYICKYKLLCILKILKLAMNITWLKSFYSSEVFIVAPRLQLTRSKDYTFVGYTCSASIYYWKAQQKQYIIHLFSNFADSFVTFHSFFTIQQFFSRVTVNSLWVPIRRMLGKLSFTF